MYLSTAGLTGVLVVGMFVLTPENVRVGRFVIFLIAICVITGSLPIRKGVAMAIEYLINDRWGPERDSATDAIERDETQR